MATNFHSTALQKGKSNTFSLANGRVAAFHNAQDPLATSQYIVAASLDASDKRSARIFLAARITESALRRWDEEAGAV